MVNKKPLVFSHYTPAAQAGVCWYCGEVRWGLARFQIPRADGGIWGGPHARGGALAEVCPGCVPRAARGERGNG
jgi:hypothetical protein